MIIDNERELKLDAGSIPEAVQVDFPPPFHHYAENNVDVWIQIQFTEIPGSEVEQIDACELLEHMFGGWLNDALLGMKKGWALDIFWGPGRGVLYNGAGKCITDW